MTRGFEDFSLNTSEKPPEEEKKKVELAEEIPAKIVVEEPTVFDTTTPDGFSQKRFFEEFSIKPEELDSIEGYNDLAGGQKYLVLDNLRQITLGRIKEEAIQKTRDETEDAGFGTRMWHGIFKNYYTARAEKESAQELMKGGIETHGEMLADLVYKTKESGVSAFYDDNKFIHYTFGNNVFQFIEEIQGISEETETSAEGAVWNFNEVAHNLATKKETDWKYKNKEGKKAEKIEEQYESARSELIEKLKNVLGEEEAIAATYDMDRKVRMQQLLNENPEAKKELQKISSQSVWWKALRNTTYEKGGYMAMGAAARTVTTALWGVFAAPLAAAGMGAWVARQRAIASLKEEAVLARGGKIDTVAAKTFTNEELILLKKKEILARTGQMGGAELKSYEEELAKAEESKKEREVGKKVEKPKPETVLNFVKADNLENRLESLMRQIYEPKDEEETRKRDEYLEMLRMRLNYTEAKIQGGLVSYGETKGQLGKKYNLLDTISRANTLAVLENAEVKEEVEERLNEYLSFKGKKISKKVHKQMLVAAVAGES